MELDQEQRREVREIARQQIGSHGIALIQSQLDSLPDVWMARCALGQAFENAVMKVIRSHRTVDEDTTEDQGGTAISDEEPLATIVGMTDELRETAARFDFNDLAQILGPDLSANIVGVLIVRIRDLETELAQAVSETMRDDVPDEGIGRPRH